MCRDTDSFHLRLPLVPSNRFLPTPAEISHRQTVELLVCYTASHFTQNLNVGNEKPRSSNDVNISNHLRHLQRDRTLVIHFCCSNYWPNTIIYLSTHLSSRTVQNDIYCSKECCCRTRIWKLEFAWKCVLRTCVWRTSLYNTVLDDFGHGDCCDKVSRLLKEEWSLPTLRDSHSNFYKWNSHVSMIQCSTQT